MSKRKIAKYVGIIVLVAVSLALIFNQKIKSYLIESYHPNISVAQVNKNRHKSAKYNYGEVKELTMANVAKARAKGKDLPIVGVISMPSIDMTLPITNGVSNQNLALSAGTLRPDVKMGQGNYALAGHNMSNLGPKTLFSPLYYKGKVGQMIYVTDLKHVYEYRVTQKQFVSKYRTDLVQNTKEKMITLITCDATGANRLMVRGTYVKKMSYRHAPTSVRKALSQQYNY